jgi:Holliday junction DNA helicase RuvA
MIAHLCGKLIAKEPRCILDVGGVGYQLQLPARDLDELKTGDPEVAFHTYLYVREDRLTLYGFRRSLDRELFTRLIEVSGIGPKIALGILSAHPADRVVAAIKQSDIVFLKGLSGLGKKTAERLAMELGGKLDDLEAAPFEASPQDTVRSEALLALTSLGMSRGSAEQALDKIELKKEDQANVEILVREALKFAGSR